MTDTPDTVAALRKVGWRYQAVWEDDAAGRQFSFCEVWLGEDDSLTGWTETAGGIPCGDDIEELTRDLVRMYVDACRWRPVAFSDLRVGMKFERLISPEQAEMLAVFFDQIPRPQ